MRKTAEKIAVLAIIVIAFVFIVMCLLYTLNILPQNSLRDNAPTFVLLVTFAVIYVAVAGYLVWLNFSSQAMLKQVLLSSDSKSASYLSAKVVKRAVISCADNIDGIMVKKVRVRSDEKNGFCLTANVEIDGEDATVLVDKLQSMIEDYFENVIGLYFNTIAFRIDKVRSSYTPSLEQAEKRAEQNKKEQDAFDENDKTKEQTEKGKPNT